MAIKRGLYTPDFGADMQQPEWMDMGPPQEVNIQPAVGAFQQRFMGGNKGDMDNVPNPTMNDLPEMDAAMPAGGSPMGGAPKKKSL